MVLILIIMEIVVNFQKICNSLCGNGLSKEILAFLDGGEFDLICESGIYESDKRYC